VTGDTDDTDDTGDTGDTDDTDDTGGQTWTFARAASMPAQI
jgi:hypothetical protein